VFRAAWVKRIITRAVEATRYPGASPQAVYDELCANSANPNFGVFAALDQRALAIVVLPSSVLMMAPQVVLAYNDGRPLLARLIAARRNEIRSELTRWQLAAGHLTAAGHISMRSALIRQGTSCLPRAQRRAV
jgi:hypothetical protein